MVQVPFFLHVLTNSMPKKRVYILTVYILSLNIVNRSRWEPSSHTRSDCVRLYSWWAFGQFDAKAILCQID